VDTRTGCTYDGVAHTTIEEGFPVLDKQTIAIPCPQCGKKADKTITWLKANDKFTCGGCGGNVTVDRNQFLSEIKKAEKMLADFKRSLGKR